MSTTKTDVLHIGDAVTLGLILDACSHNYPVTWLARDENGEIFDGRTISGTARAIVADNEGRCLIIGRDIDVRDGFIWVSSTFEHFLPVRDAIKWVNAGEMALNYRA